MIPALVIRKDKGIGWKLPFTDAELQAIARGMLDAAGFSHAYVELSVLSDAAMAVLHERSLACCGPTNILSFPARAASGKTPASSRTPHTESRKAEKEGAFFGWLALSADTLHRECFLYGQQAGEHCIRLLAHGIAHILGHDHSQKMDFLCEQLELTGASAFSAL